MTKMDFKMAPGNAVLSNFLNENYVQPQNSSMYNFPRITEEITNEDFINLTNAINYQKQRITDMSINQWHNIHHYSILYILIIGILISATYIWLKRRKESAVKRNQRPTPAPRSIRMEEVSNEDLPSLNVEVGECA